MTDETTDLQLAGRPVEAGTSRADVSVYLRRAVEVVSNAKSMPLSASVLISRDEVLALLDQALEHLPDELREARWMLREREEFLAKTRKEADSVLESARVQAERMVQRSEITRQAELSAQRTLEIARDEASRLRHEAEDYCDQKLAAFEIVLERTAKLVRAGREKLQGVPPRDDSRGGSGGGGSAGSRPDGVAGPGGRGDTAALSERGAPPEGAFFDQDS